MRSRVEVPEAVHPSEARAGVQYVTVPIGPATLVLVHASDEAAVRARVAQADAVDAEMERQRLAARTAVPV